MRDRRVVSGSVVIIDRVSPEQNLTFELYSWRWQFRAVDLIRLHHAANTIRGALGMALADSPEYRQWFRPEATGAHPSGLADPPRPFVLRTMHLDNAVIRSGETFAFDLFTFETSVDRSQLLSSAMAAMAQAGLGPNRGRATLEDASREHISLSLHPPSRPVTRIRVRFLSATELKGGDPADFSTLFCRARDRIASLRSLYGAGSLDVDFRSLGQRSATIQTECFETEVVSRERRSSRTGQTHPVGGFTGVAQYSGDLRDFVPWLEAAQWTGVGRQTVWGKGAIRVEQLQ